MGKLLGTTDIASISILAILLIIILGAIITIFIKRKTHKFRIGIASLLLASLIYYYREGLLVAFNLDPVFATTILQAIWGVDK